jgi:cell division septation protein DedD
VSQGGRTRPGAALHAAMAFAATSGKRLCARAMRFSRAFLVDGWRRGLSAGRAAAAPKAHHASGGSAAFASARTAAGRWVDAARRVPPGPAAAGAIATVTLALAVVAGDSDREYPGAAFEAALLSHATAQAGEASNWLVMDATLADGVLAERLVEDPWLEPTSTLAAGGPAAAPADGTDTPMPPLMTSPATAEAQAGGVVPATSDEFPGPHAMAAGGSSGAAIAVLSAVTPPPPAGRSGRTGGDEHPGQSRDAGGADAAVPAAASAAPPPAAVTTSSSEFAVQLVAVSRRDQADDAWSRLRRENVDLLGELRPLILDPDGRRTSLYRLRAGPITSAEQAGSLCASLNARRVDCIVVRNDG